MYEIILEENDRIMRLGWEETQEEAERKAIDYIEIRGQGDYEVRVEEDKNE